MKCEPVLAVDVQCSMIGAVEKRFGGMSLPRMIQFLSDRGSIYRANYLTQLNLESCFTIAYRPEYNEMGEAFVKTIKIDYVYVNDCVDSKAVLEMLPSWFNDFKEIAPHSARGMLNPMKYQMKSN